MRSLIDTASQKLFLLASALLLIGCGNNGGDKVDPGGTPEPPAAVIPQGSPTDGPLKKMDTDGDGFVSFDEFSASSIAQNAPGPEAVRQRFDQIDSDKDGRLSKDELRVAMEKMRAAGGGGGEGPAGGDNPAGGGGNPVDRLDTDGDKAVSFDEFMAGPGGQGERQEARDRFDRIDSDRDGKLSGDEIRAFFQSRNQNGNSGAGRGPGNL